MPVALPQALGATALPVERMNHQSIVPVGVPQGIFLYSCSPYSRDGHDIDVDA